MPAGLHPATKHREVSIVSIGAVSEKYGFEFHTYINPNRDISFGASRTHGITKDPYGRLLHNGQQILNVASPKDGLRSFLDYLRSCMGTSGRGVILAAHNASEFDSRVLCYELLRYGLEEEAADVIEDFICTLEMARNVVGHGRHNLQELAMRYYVSGVQNHDALDDAKVLRSVAREIACQMGCGDVRAFLLQNARPIAFGQRLEDSRRILISRTE